MPLVGIYSPFFQALFVVNFTISKCVDVKNWQMAKNRWAVLSEHLMGGGNCIWHLSGIWFILLWIIVIHMIMDHQIFVKCMSMQLACYIFQNMAGVYRRWWWQWRRRRRQRWWWRQWWGWRCIWYNLYVGNWLRTSREGCGPLHQTAMCSFKCNVSQMQCISNAP